MQSMELKQFCKTILPASAALLLLGITFPARAALERVGPANAAPSVGGFPAWYQDSSGLSIEFCDPQNAAEVAGGWCLLLAGDVPTVPEVFPTSFFDEHFYFDASTTLTPATGGKALLTMALEGAFAGTGAVAPGQQITFTRIRVNLNPVPKTGTYRFVHPYGEEHISANAGDRIFFTDDVGINCPPGTFDCAMTGRLGPFLLPSDAPGGAETAPVTAANPFPDQNPAHFGGVFAPTAYPGTGKTYLADPSRLGPVTGSPLPPFTDSTGALRNHNIFRVEGPAGSGLGGPGIDYVETTDFNLMGRVFTQTIPGRVTLDRASYTRTATATKLDVFASGSETIQGRIPGQPAPAPASPALSFYSAPCGNDPVTGALLAPVGLTDQQLFQDGTWFWAQMVPGAAIPSAVCVKDSAARDVTGATVPAFFQSVVTDEIAITKALYDPDTEVLTVNATSSDSVTPPALSVDGFGSMTASVLTVTPKFAPPASIRVRSSLGAFADLDVTTNYMGAAAGALRAINDAYSFAENSPAQILDVLTNDVSAAGGTVAIVSQGRLGTATANVDGTVTYTPNANASGSDVFTYQVTTAAGTSNIADVSITITFVNYPPTAVNDGPFNVVAGIATQLPNLLANDTDLNGSAQLAAPAAAVNIVAPAGVVVSGGAAGLVTVTVGTPGTYTFTYQTQNAGGLVSANAATVTLNVVPNDTITVTKALFTASSKRWVVTGTTAVPNQTLTLTYADGSAAGHVLATVPVDALGNWTLDIRGVSGLDDASTLAVPPTTLQATSSFGGTATTPITYK